jgi:molybdenum cofactor biosynthesis protein B
MAYQEHTRQAAPIIAHFAVITLSDTRTAETDKSGNRIRELIEQAGHVVTIHQIIRDEPSVLTALLDAILQRDDIDAIITTGGTGISRRDSTIDVIDQRLQQSLPGFGELFRFLSFQEIGSGAMLSRASGGIISGKLLFALPGSQAAVELGMTRLILPEIRHLLRELRKQ